MIRMIEPDYIHYTRLETIYADEAEWLLAVFDLREKEFSDKDLYEAQFNEQRRLAGRVLCNAFKKPLKPIYDDPDAISRNDYGVIDGYVFSLISINVVSFCSWALELKYNLPDVLVTLVKGSDCNIVSEEQGNQMAEDSQKLDESQKTDAAPATEEVPDEEPSEADEAMEEAETPEPGETQADDDDNKSHGNTIANEAPPVNPEGKKGGKPTGYLAEAIKFAYLKYRKEGNTEILRENKIREFIGRLKELADEKGNPNFSEYIANRIEYVKISPAGCTIKTKDKYLNASNTREIKDKGRNYSLARVSQILVDLRGKHPLP